MGLLTALAIAAGAGGAVVSAPIVLGAVGFTSAGIATAAAVTNGGFFAAGVLQPAVAGLPWAATTAVASFGGAVGGLVATLI